MWFNIFKYVLKIVLLELVDVAIKWFRKTATKAVLSMVVATA